MALRIINAVAKDDDDLIAIPSSQMELATERALALQDIADVVASMAEVYSDDIVIQTLARYVETRVDQASKRAEVA